MRKSTKRGGIILLLLAFLFIWFIKTTHDLQPTLIAMAKIQSEALATDILSEAMRSVLEESGVQSGDLVHYYYNADGQVFAYSVDTVTIEKLAAMVNAKMGLLLKEQAAFTLKIPIGQLTSNPLLAALGPDIPVSVRVVGNPGVNYGRTFEAAGINEVNHRIFLKMELLIQVTTPLLTDVLSSEMEFTLVDQTLAGQVPLTYMGMTSN